jgi:ribosomal protein L11 methylase PrmA
MPWSSNNLVLNSESSPPEINDLVGLCEHFSKLVKLGGQLVLSGILHEQLEIILDAYGEYFSELKVAQKEGTACGSLSTQRA